MHLLIASASLPPEPSVRTSFLHQHGLWRTALRRFSFFLISLIILWAVVGYLATLPVVSNHPFWRKLRAQPQDFNLNAETVSFPSTDGIPLVAWYIHADGSPRATVILAHGIDGNRSDMLPRAWFLVRNHYNTLLVDLRAHGGSGGNYATPGYMESRDVLGAVDYLRNTRHQSGPIVAFGHSYGAVACLWAAAQSREIAAVIADGAFISFQNMMRRATELLAADPTRSPLQRFGLRLAGSRIAEWIVLPMYYLRTGVWPSIKEGNVLNAVPRIDDRAILFIAGQLDEICPPSNARLMYDLAESPKKAILIVPGADHDHTLAASLHLYEETVLHFLQNALLAGSAHAEQSMVDNQNDDRTNNRNEDTVKIYPGHPNVANRVEEPAAHNSANDS